MTKIVANLLIVLGGCSVVFTGCGYSEEEMQAKQDRIDALTAKLNEESSRSNRLKERLDALTESNAVMIAKLKKMGVSIEQLESEKGELQSTVEELSAREKAAQARLNTFRQLLDQFRSMIASGKLRVRIVRNRMVVEMQEDILFASGKATLDKKEGQSALQEVAKVLQTIKNRDFQVAGHTDNVPISSKKFPSNWELSSARAVNILKFLIENGVSRARLSATGYADTQPVASNDTKEGRKQNRRIEIVLLPNLDELPDLSSLQQKSDS